MSTAASLRSFLQAVTFFKKKQVSFVIYMNLNFQVFHLYLRELSILTQNVNNPNMHFRQHLLDSKKEFVLHTLFFLGGAKISEKETTINFDFLVSCHRLTFRRISKNDNNPLLGVFV